MRIWGEWGVEVLRSPLNYRAVNFQSQFSGYGHHVSLACFPHVPSLESSLMHREGVTAHRLRTTVLVGPKTRLLADPSVEPRFTWEVLWLKTYSAGRPLPSVCTDNDADIMVWAAKHDNSDHEGGDVWHWLVIPSTVCSVSFFFSSMDWIIGLSLRIPLPDRKHFSTYPVPWTRHPILFSIAGWWDLRQLQR